MTLEEAIAHCEEVANDQEHDAETWEMSSKHWGDDKQSALDNADECKKCAEEHRQLADWLKLLQRILSSGDCNNCAMLHSQCRYAPRLGEQVRYNCPLFVQEESE